MEAHVSTINQNPDGYLGAENHETENFRDKLETIGWRVGRLAVLPFIHRGLSTSPENYHPVRYAEVTPDISYTVETDTGEYPVHIYNRDCLGNRSDNPDIYLHMSLMVRPDQGFVAPMIKNLDRLAHEQNRGLVVIGAPASHGRGMNSFQLARFDLHSIVNDTHEAIDGIAETEQVELTRMVHTGASLGGYLSLVFADQTIAGRREESGKQPHIVELSLPVAPAGWSLSNKRRIKAAYQFLVLEPAHFVEKASHMNKPERDEYIRSFVKTVPYKEALPGAAKLAVNFLFSGDLEDTIQRLPRDYRVTAAAFNGDYITLPYLLKQHLNEKDFPNSKVHIIDGRHLSLDSYRKIFKGIIEPEINALYEESAKVKSAHTGA